MRLSWSGSILDVVDYEIVRVSAGPAPEEIGAFADAYAHDGPPLRLVAGYLMLEERATGRLGVFSHGRPAAQLTVAEAGLRCTPWDDAAGWHETGSDYRTGGVALLPEGGQVVCDGRTLSLSGNGSLTIVHGPAEDKIDARIALYRSLRRVGGRRG